MKFIHSFSTAYPVRPCGGGGYPCIIGHSKAHPEPVASPYSWDEATSEMGCIDDWILQILEITKFAFFFFFLPRKWAGCPKWSIHNPSLISLGPLIFRGIGNIYKDLSWVCCFGASVIFLFCCGELAVVCCIYSF